MIMTKTARPSHTDIQQQGWWRLLPVGLHPYVFIARLDRPIGWWLLLLPAWWSIALTAPDRSTMVMLMLVFMLGAIITRAAGCIINDMWDRRLDQKVARTAKRPLAAGTMSVGQAFLYMLGLGLAGLVVLVQLPIMAIYVGLSAIPLVVLYPLAKRVTWFPQVVLGLTFAWGVPLGWAANHTDLAQPALGLIYAGTAAWIFGYDTIYAIQDMDDDRRVGVKSSALAFVGGLKRAIALSYGLAILLLGVGLYQFGLSVSGSDAFGWVGLGLMAVHLAWQTIQIKNVDPAQALILFMSNRNAGLFLAGGLALAQIFAP